MNHHTGRSNMTHCHAGLETCISLKSNCWILHLNSICVPRQVTHLHPSPEIFVSIPSSSLDYHLYSIQVTYHPQPGPKTCISPSSLSQDLHLKPIQVLPQIDPCLDVSHSHIDPIGLYLGPGISVSPPSNSQGLHLNSIQVRLISIHVPRLALRPYPCP